MSTAKEPEKRKDSQKHQWFNERKQDRPRI